MHSFGFYRERTFHVSGSPKAFADCLRSPFFWGSLAFTLIGGTAVGTVLTLVFLPALYSIWFRVIPSAKRHSSRELATQ
jgi:hypothetical protein